jgi:hypothetical protein
VDATIARAKELDAAVYLGKMEIPTVDGSVGLKGAASQLILAS